MQFAPQTSNNAQATFDAVRDCVIHAIQQKVEDGCDTTKALRDLKHIEFDAEKPT